MPCRGKRGCLRKPSATSCHKINQCSWAVCLVTQSCPTLCDLMDWSQPGFSLPGDSSGKNTRVGGHALLQGILPTQGSNPHLPHYRQILFHLSHQGSPRILEWVAYPFSRGSSWPRDWTGVSWVAGVFFTSWATREGVKEISSVGRYVRKRHNVLGIIKYRAALAFACCVRLHIVCSLFNL